MVEHNKKMRGTFKNKKKAKRIHDFRGLRWDNITPTDIDLCLDFQDTSFVFGEGKTRGASWEHGQRLALTRVVDACAKGGRRAVLLLWEDPPGYDDVVVKNQIVKESYRNEKWNCHGYVDLTMKQAIDKFLNEAGKIKTPEGAGVSDDVLRRMGYDI